MVKTNLNDADFEYDLMILKKVGDRLGTAPRNWQWD